MVKTRQHWMAILRFDIFFIFTIACCLLWAAYHPREIIHLLHIYRDSPYSPFIKNFYDHKNLYISSLFGFFALMIFFSWGNWYCSSYEINGRHLTYKKGPFHQETIPLWTILDIRKDMGMFGSFFNYGTITIENRNEREILPYVPYPDDFIEEIGSGMQ